MEILLKSKSGSNLEEWNRFSDSMRVVAISDTQGAHMNFPVEQLPAGDVLVHAGDITCHSRIDELESFNEWLRSLPFQYKLVIAGNHDRPLATDLGLGSKIFTNADYLQNEGIEIDGIYFWGSPQNLIQGSWAFNDNEQEQVEQIPENVDILITHGPPYGILDKMVNGRHGINGAHGGSRLLLSRVLETEPPYHICGHIHEAYGYHETDATSFLNVAMQDERGVMFIPGTRQLIHAPVVIDL